MTVHNRKVKTIDCLRSLFKCTLPNGYEISVFMVNDGCTDGTEQAVETEFSSVNIIQGTGNLFWNRGMLLAWKTAIEIKDFDYYVWLNDDVQLFNQALSDLVESAEKVHNQAIICGTTCAPENHSQITYGGRIKSVGIVFPNGQLQSCDCCNGQLCLIPRSVYQIMGMNDPIFHHGFGDWDYGFRAKKKGIDIFVAPDISGICDVNRNDEFPSHMNPQKSLLERVNILYSPLGKNPWQFFVYSYRHNSLVSAICTYLLLHLEVFFPSALKKKK